MFSTRGQNAWGSSQGLSHQRLNVEDSDKIWFEQWLVGVTDGDGSFSIIRQPKGGDKFNLVFKIGQSPYNLRLLYYIKKQLNVGSVYVEGDNGHYRIRDRKIINQVIFPIFDKYPLLTTKYFNYIKFKQAYQILENKELSKQDKTRRLEALIAKKPSEDYVSPAWGSKRDVLNIFETKKIMSKPWLVGFTEAEGSFFIVQKEVGRLVHCFGMTQKLDKIVLESMRQILHIPAKVQLREVELRSRDKTRSTYYKLETTNSRAIQNIVDYFAGTMKGMKAVEYKI